MYNKIVQYSVELAGETTHNGIPVVVMNLTFVNGVRDKVGMGGQGTVDYSSRGVGGITDCRIFIEPEKAVPLFIGCSREPIEDAQATYDVSWGFDPDFFEIHGGFAPKIIDSMDSSSFNERQEFQVINGVWIFKTGSAWYGDSSNYGKTGLIQTIDLIDLVITNAATPLKIDQWQMH